MQLWYWPSVDYTADELDESLEAVFEIVSPGLVFGAFFSLLIKIEKFKSLDSFSVHHEQY